MKFIFFTRLLFIIATFSLLSISCSKDGDDNGDTTDPTEEQLPTGKQDAETKIQGKWNVNASGEVRSLEFLDGDTYVLEVASSSSLASRKAILSARAAHAGLNGGFKSETGGNNSTEKISGKFTVSADGKTITLGDIARITISGISENSFSFTITFIESNREQSVSATIVAPVATSQKTQLLVGNWGSSSWMYYEAADVRVLEGKGFKPQDEGFMFTATGTMIMRYINYEQSSSVDPETGLPSEVITNVSLDTDIYSWEWKDSQQTVVKVSRNGDTFEITIENLTQSRLTARLENGNNWVLESL
ncbi:hypothetical protein H8B06_13735 [Sphingobacterium sp. DN00404]|uniref:Lipocalin-like domain-containing protein n=1 Tax=Sphingobacterium micropteri TaxID=2763501 RepID=A0ABR7YRI0_9SPHI|nr:hypothetical protein [Sphingobacterium micropteri]MBD1433894.1 hypothetical protein [Sphingobacterium micropteri]